MVLVLWDDGANRPRGKTHALDCNWVDGLERNATDDYRKVDVREIPDNVPRCGFCGGGRPEPGKGRSRQLRHSSPPPGNAVVDERPEPVGALEVGGTARVLDEESGKVHAWTVVKQGEADPARGRLSTESPVAKALLGRVAGETVRVETLRGPRRYTVMELVT